MYGDLTGISVCDTWPHFAADKRILWSFDSFFTLVWTRLTEKRYYTVKTLRKFYLTEEK